MRHIALRLALAAGLALLVLAIWVTPGRAAEQIHIVQPGENLFRISLRYGVTVQAIQAANGLNSYIIYVGQALVIPDTSAPVATTLPATPLPATPAASLTHVVQPGETLFLIGLSYNIPWNKIQAANGLAGEKIYVGQSLIIPLDAGTATPSTADTQPATDTPLATSTPAPVTDTPAPTVASATDTLAAAPPTPAPTATPTETATETPAATPAPGGTTYTVLAGDTLFTIGLKFGLMWTTIQQANGLAGASIYAGQQLIIPASDSGYAAAGVVAPPPPPGTGKRFLVVLSEQRLYAYEDNQMVRTTLISSGVPGYQTVTGTFHVYLRYLSARMIGPGYDLPNVPYVMYFYQSYGLHGTYWHHNFGHPMSHGCVNMPTSEAEWAYNWSTYGTPVIIRY
jgi:LysM repeat protein